MGDKIRGESFLRMNFPGWNSPGGSSMSGNLLDRSFSGAILKFVNTYILLTKFCCQNETLMSQINTNLTFYCTAYHKWQNTKRKKIPSETKKNQFAFLNVCTTCCTSYVIWRHCISLDHSSNITGEKLRGGNNFRKKHNAKYS